MRVRLGWDATWPILAFTTTEGGQTGHGFSLRRGRVFEARTAHDVFPRLMQAGGAEGPARWSSINRDYLSPYRWALQPHSAAGTLFAPPVRPVSCLTCPQFCEYAGSPRVGSVRSV